MIALPPFIRPMSLLSSAGSLIGGAKVPQKTALLQCSTSHLRASTSCARSITVAEQPLKAWQREKLEAAFAKGRRHVSVSAHCPCCCARCQHCGPCAPSQVRGMNHLRPSIIAILVSVLSQIQQLSTDTQMDRSDVLKYLKGLDKLPQRCGAIHGHSQMLSPP